LRLSFFRWNSLIHFFPSENAESPRQLGLYRGLTETLKFEWSLRLRSPLRAKRHTRATTGETSHT
jgi:hypothetical protein